MIIKILISVVVSYIIGAIPFSFIIGKVNGHDVRKEGSCNPGQVMCFVFAVKRLVLLLIFAI